MGGLMNRIFALCGKIGSGKSYAADVISKEYNGIIFSIDKIMLKLYGEIDGRELFEERYKLCKEMIYEISEKILENTNGDLIFDFGFWTEKDRNNLRERFKKYKIIFIYIKTEDNLRWERIKKRNEENKIDNYKFDKETFDFLSDLFEELSEEKEYILFEDIKQLIGEINRIKPVNRKI
jgi:dephospho-CoA kinase